jgi:hypothetical protein
LVPALVECVAADFAPTECDGAEVLPDDVLLAVDLEDFADAGELAAEELEADAEAGAVPDCAIPTPPR